MSNPICFALDVPKLSTAQGFVDRLEAHVGAFKVGLEMFIASGAMPVTKKPVVLDLKLHDIPETVARAVKAGGDLGVKFMTLHIQQKSALEAAVKAAEPFGITLLGVTVLTSMTEQDCQDLRFHDDNSIQGRVLNLARFAVVQCGLKGLVCSPKEVAFLRLNFTEKEQPFLLVPGVRPLGSETGDQRRTGTPGGAVVDGANLIVIGRPIRDAQDPVVAAQAILKEVQEAQRVEKVAQDGFREIAR